jgi:uracil-DNA glycosylase
MVFQPGFPTAEPFLPPRMTLPALQKASRGCEGCPLHKTGTQTVFGEGPPNARAMFIGEQPGDQEDRAGRPFVGPAGRLLDQGLEEAGIDRSLVYVTNVVKHFKWEPRGKRRVHSKPSSREIAACKPWLMAELEVIKPRAIVCLGASAAQGLMGPAFRITRERGKVFAGTVYGPWLMATIHPSAILRMPTPESRQIAWQQFLADLSTVRSHLQERRQP